MSGIDSEAMLWPLKVSDSGGRHVPAPTLAPTRATMNGTDKRKVDPKARLRQAAMFLQGKRDLGPLTLSMPGLLGGGGR